MSKYEPPIASTVRCVDIKNIKHERLKFTRRQSGMVLGEYLIGTSLVAIALFAPMPVLGESAFAFLLDALRNYQAHTTYLMSMP